MDNLSNLELELNEINSVDNVLFIDYLNKTDNSILQESVIKRRHSEISQLYDTFLKTRKSRTLPA